MVEYLISLTWGAGRGALLNPFIKNMAYNMVDKMARICERDGVKYSVRKSPVGVFVNFWDEDMTLVESLKKQDNKAFKQLKKLGINYSVEEVVASG